jgi:murein DD-endopeptidase MepM/ murein hydrolase activator NlpD
MRPGSDGRRRNAVFAVLALGLLLAACAPRVEGPAPVITGEPAEQRGPVSVTVQRGQSLSGIAHAYHVPMRAIAEANGLSPPYRIQVGRTLVIPGAGQSRVPPVSSSVTALPPQSQPDTPPLAPRSEAPNAASGRPPPVVSMSLAPATAPSSATAAVPPPNIAPAAPSAAPAPENPPPNATTPAPSRSNSAFLWPVKGRVLAAFGSKGDGTHNDGINIGAPKGAAVQAADAGVVAYTGNELRGYGNLILIKHSNGWISAYAHCDLILVKRGDKVTRGEVIARVGSTGNVGEPQLHFELRRGNRPVDPREHLAPLPTADTMTSRNG